ncbi:MAG: hypothetical protein CSYNP_04285 [Syntrophus sp. SKADARSKE-3]|nr:hypothetical protein [Syntrophus sp. SKADARSKE-3]
MKNTNYQKYLNGYLHFDALLWNASRDAASRGDAIHIQSRKGNLVCEYRDLPFDSSILGVTVARIENIFFPKYPKADEITGFLKQIDDVLRQKSIVLASFRLGCDHFPFFSALEENGWYLADVLNVYGCDPSHLVSGRSQYPLQAVAVNLTGIDEVLESCRETYPYSRIFRDRHIRNNVADIFYKRLIAAAGENETTSKMAVRKDSETIGFIIGERDELLFQKTRFRLSYLCHIMIKSQYRGRGFSHQLFSAFLDAESASGNFVEISTQMDNRPANRLYLSAGLVPVANAITFHRWLTPKMRQNADNCH